MICPNCKKELPDTAKFCGGCGTKLPEAPVEAPVETPVEAAVEAPTEAPVEEASAEAAPVAEAEATAEETANEAATEETVAEAPVEEAKEAEETAAPVEAAPVAVATVASADDGANSVAAGKSFGEIKNKVVTALKKVPKFVYGIAGAAVALILVICIIVGIVGAVTAPSLPSYGMYVKDGELYYSNLSKKPWELTSNLSTDDISNSSWLSSAYELAAMTTLSKDEKTLFYPDKINMLDEGFTIYYKSAKKAKAEGTKLDSDITTYHVNDKATLVTYLKGDDDNLYQYNMKKKDKEKLDGDVEQFWVSDDGKIVRWIDTDGGLYYKKDGKEKVKISGDVNKTLYITEDFKTIYYLKDGNLYSCEGTKDAKKIASDVTDVLKVYESGEVYFYTTEKTEAKYIDYLYDDLKESDAAMTEPESPEYPSREYPEYPEYPDYPDYPSIEYPDYPSFGDYATRDEYNAAVDAYYEERDRLDEEADAKYDVAKEDYNKAVDEYEAECDRLDEEADKAYEKAMEDYEAAYEKYQEDYTEYYSKQTRDSIRESLAEETLSSSTYSLMYFNGKKDIKTVSSSLYRGGYSTSVIFAEEEPTVIYKQILAGEAEKVKMSECGENSYYSLYTVMEKISDAVEGDGNMEVYVAVEDKATKTEISEYAEIEITDDGKEVYYTAGYEAEADDDVDAEDADEEADEKDESEGYELKKMTLSGSKIKKTETYDKEVSTSGLFVTAHGDVVYYKDYSDKGVGTLYINKKKVSDDVYSVRYNEESEKFTYLTDYDSEKYEGTLYVYAKKKATKLADDVRTYTVLPNGNILYIADFSQKTFKGDLFLVEKKKPKKLDEDVACILPIYENEHSIAAGNFVEEVYLESGSAY